MQSLKTQYFESYNTQEERQVFYVIPLCLFIFSKANTSESFLSLFLVFISMFLHGIHIPSYYLMF